ncbi:MAG TPA: hypothetical protein VIT91_21545 [Chthoniobacterales bacterium]
MPISFARRTAIFWSLVLAVYLLGYLIVRATLVHTWQRDGQSYVIFPEWPRSLYYVYRPMADLDGKITGMRFRQSSITEAK